MTILNTAVTDIDQIFKIYDDATAYQKKVHIKSWRGFERKLVMQEITEQRHYKIMEGDTIASTFLLAYINPIIWGDSGDDNAIYIHRIATNPQFREQSYAKIIAAWVTKLARIRGISFIRLDTHSGNVRLHKYYENCGFTYKGVKTIVWTDALPEHYKDGPFSLFEITPLKRKI